MRRWQDPEKVELAKNVAAALFLLVALYVAMVALVVSHP